MTDLEETEYKVQNQNQRDEIELQLEREIIEAISGERDVDDTIISVNTRTDSKKRWAVRVEQRLYVGDKSNIVSRLDYKNDEDGFHHRNWFFICKYDKEEGIMTIAKMGNNFKKISNIPSKLSI